MKQIFVAGMLVLSAAATQVKKGNVPPDALKSFQDNIRRDQMKEEEEDRPEEYRYDVNESDEETKVKDLTEPQQDDEE